MTAIFADTFYWVALTDADDALYQRAAHLEGQFGNTPIVTIDGVLSESPEGFLRRSLAAPQHGRDTAGAVIVMEDRRCACCSTSK